MSCMRSAFSDTAPDVTEKSFVAKDAIPLFVVSALSPDITPLASMLIPVPPLKRPRILASVTLVNVN